jgi:ABC-2 type transport system permease protein
MMRRLRQYLAVYGKFLSTCFAAASTYRLHFVLLIVMDQLFYFSLLGSVDFIFDQVPVIGPWSRDHFMFFIAFMLAVDHLHMTFVSESFWEFSYDLRTGRLDFILLRPLNTLFTIFARLIRPATMVNVVTPWAFLIHFGLALDLQASAWFFLLPLVVLALLLLTSIEILLSMLMFWTVESFGINFLRMQLQTVSRWPDFIYPTWSKRIFTLVIPILLVGSAPVRFLFDPTQWIGVMAMLVALGVTWILIAFVWRLGLRSYESASS